MADGHVLEVLAVLGDFAAPVLAEVLLEMARQDAKFGPRQPHPDWTSSHTMQHPAGVLARSDCERAFELGEGSWTHVLVEEVGEAIDEPCMAHPAQLRAELVQVAAVCLQWIKAIDKRGET